MKLSKQQLARLRRIGRIADDLDMRQRAAYRAADTCNDYQRELHARIHQIDRDLIRYTDPEVKLAAERAELLERIEESKRERAQINEISKVRSTFSIAYNETLGRCLSKARLTRAQLGVPFGNSDSRALADVVVTR